MPDIEDIYDADAEQAQLFVLLSARYRTLLKTIHEAVREEYDLDPDTFRLDDPSVRRVLEDCAERVVRIDETTREAIRETLQEGQRRGYSLYQMANGVPKDDYRGIEGLFEETWKGRPETVARTEITHAQRTAALDRYAATGLVDRVRIIDGDYDSVCASRNGTVVPLADRPDLAHPNCRMVVSPILRGERAE
jgi:hypothetical protein